MALRGYFHVCRQGLAADRPANPSGDWIYYATDTGQLSVYESGGAAWSNVGFSGLSDPVAIGDGGTGQTSQTPAFDALAPTTTKGDLIVYNGTDNVRLAVGANDGTHLLVDSVASEGVSWVRQTQLYLLYAADPLVAGSAFTIATGANDPFGGAAPNQVNFHKRDFTGFREGRILLTAAGSSLNAGNIVAYIYDVTNSQKITGNVSIPANNNIVHRTGTWTSLNSATYGGDAEFDLEFDGNVGDICAISTVALELR